MSGDNNTAALDDAEDSDTGETKVVDVKTLEEALTEIGRLRSVNSQVVQRRDKLRQNLRETKATLKTKETELADVGQYKAKFVEADTKLKKIDEDTKKAKTNEQLKKVLSDAGVTAVDTAIELVKHEELKFGSDGTITPESGTELIAKLKEKHGILFGSKGTTPAPTPARAAGQEANPGLEAELQQWKADVASGLINGTKIKTTRDAILKKYNKS